MKKYSIIFILLILMINVMAQYQFDIFSCKAPAGFQLKAHSEYLFYEKKEGDNYCQLFLYPATTGLSDVEKDFETNWNFFARNASQGVNNPDTKEKDSVNGWQVIFAGAKGSYNKMPFVTVVTTLTKAEITFYAAAVFSDKKYLQNVQDFIGSIEPDTNKFVHKNSPNNQPDVIINTTAANNGITKFNTNFDDGWHAIAMQDYVRVTMASTEVRLHYIDAALDDARPNTIDAPEYYWSKYVTPYFNVNNPQKWSGVNYPVIYFMEANAVDKKTGRSCYVAIKIFYGGGARPIVIIAPNQSVYQQQFPHPNDADKMLNYNKFAVTAADIVGTWKGSGGGGVEYYNAYTGNYAGMSAISTTDEFSFNSNGTYSSQYRSANMNNGGSQFGAQDFNGKFSVTDWNVNATNRFGGKTTNFNAQLIAVKGGCLLYLSDPDNSSMNYTLYKAK